MKSALRVGVPSTWIAPPERSTPCEKLPALMLAWLSLNTAPASIIRVTPLGTSSAVPSASGTLGVIVLSKPIS